MAIGSKLLASRSLSQPFDSAVIDFTECYHPPPSLSSLQPRLDFVLSKEATADEDDKTLFKVEHTDGLDTFYHYP